MSRRDFVIGVAALLVVVWAQSIAHLWETVHLSVLGSIVDLDRHNGVPDVVSTIAIAAAAAGAGALARWTADRDVRRTASCLAFALTVVALDDLTQATIGTASLTGLAVLATAGVTAALTVAVAFSSGARPRTAIVAGLVALAASLASGEAPNVNSWLERARGDPIIEYQIVAKQGLELIGWWLIALGLWDRALGARRIAHERVVVPLRPRDPGRRPPPGSLPDAARSSAGGGGEATHLAEIRGDVVQRAVRADREGDRSGRVSREDCGPHWSSGLAQGDE